MKPFDYYRMYLQPQLKRCHTIYCRTLSNVSHAWDLISHRDTPNSLARLVPYPDNFFSESGAHAARLIVSLPDPAMTCFVEQKIIRELPVPLNDPGSLYEMMELVSELPSGWEQCRKGVIAAMPPTPTSAEWIAQADEIR